jgi:hypothetical protein
MTLQVSFISLLIVAVFYAMAGGVLVLLDRAMRPGQWRWAVTAPIAVAALIAPWVDEVWIAWRFHELCKDSGVHIVRKVEVEGFYDSTLRSGYERIDQFGFRYMEHPSVDRKKIEHVTKVQGKWQASIVDKPTARYHYKATRDHDDAGYQLEALEYTVADSQTGEIIGRDTTYKRYPGWVNALWIRYLGSGMTMCPASERGVQRQPFPESVLRPINVK